MELLKSLLNDLLKSWRENCAILSNRITPKHYYWKGRKGPMMQIDNKIKVFCVAALTAGVTYLHYSTHLQLHHYHIFYRQLYFLPIILAGFWFGLRGAMVSSLSITALYLPFVCLYWEGFSPDDFNQVLGICFYNIVAAVLGRLRDRERIEQERLREAENLAAMGKAVSGVAHDMKTPLVAIGGFSRMVQKRFDRKDPEYEKLEIVIRETRRLEEMMKDMLDFARPLELHRCWEDLNEMVKESVSSVEEVARKRGISIECLLSEDLPLIPLDSMRMQRALINLMVNAVQASPAGGVVTVRMHRKGSRVMIDIIDSGCGIPPDKREAVFRPFFTTKKEGTGLGLCIVKKVIEAHQGEVRIIENPECGITFRVAFDVNGNASAVRRLSHGAPVLLDRSALAGGLNHRK
jgi:signal transduction histidine kinase